MNNFKLEGKYTIADVYANTCDNETISQIQEIINQPFMENCKVAIMPDCHSGKGCVVGTTVTLNGKVNVNMVGVDIGCGMLTIPLKEKEIDLNKLDEVIAKHIPSGMNIHKDEKEFSELNNLIADVNLSRAKKSIGTLGGGNHFIEINKDEENNLYLVIHTGSRHLGLEIANYHHNKAIEYQQELKSNMTKQLIEKLENENREQEISKEITRTIPKIKKEYSYLEGELLEDYLNDMKIAQKFAIENRKTIANTIINHMNFDKSCFNNAFETIHNYIDFESNILRKGSVSANKGETLLIPMNMRDGSLICIGKGNKEWNCSAPHGAGRLMSRSQAKENIFLDEYISVMNGIFSTSVCQETIDESPMAYKPMEEIIDCITETVEIVKIIKPIYNFKAH